MLLLCCYVRDADAKAFTGISSREFSVRGDSRHLSYGSSVTCVSAVRLRGGASLDAYFGQVRGSHRIERRDRTTARKVQAAITSSGWPA